MNSGITRMINDFMKLRIKEPALDPILNELRHAALEYSRTLVRRQPADVVPQPGQSIEFTWEVFQEDPTSLLQEPGDGEFTLLFQTESAHEIIPQENNQVLLRGSFQVENVIPTQDGDGKTFIIELRELA